jgi:hypothetical protein
MAIITYSSQYRYNKRGPLDSKALVKTYADLLKQSTWLIEDTVAAYNGMITAVWLNKDDTSKNGIYFLFDPAATSALKVPDVTNEANWHKLVDVSELTDFTQSLSALEARIAALEEDSDIVTYGYRSGFPTVGEANKLYIAADEGKSYVWFNDNYLLVSSAENEYEEPDVINGGTAD